MKVLGQVFDFYINSSIHVGIAVFSLACITLLEFNMPMDFNLLYFIFFATITGYNFVKYFGVAKFHHRSLATWLRSIQVFSLLSFMAMCYFAFQLPIKTLLYIAGFGVVTFLYAIPFLPKHIFIDQKQNLRSIGGLKIYLITLVWTGVTVFLPLLNKNLHFDADVYLTAFQRFILVIVLMLPFEIRDLQYDSLRLSTIPQKIGVKRTKVSGVILALGFFILEFFKETTDFYQIGILFTVTLITILFLVLAKINQSKYYSSFWVEGIPVLWLILLLLVQ